jgi:cell fate regulator YaaT (PSP1 superfamily)
MPDSGASVAGIRFRNAGKIFYFHAGGMRLDPGEYVVVETIRGPEVGRVVIAPGQVLVNELGREELKPILRLATADDIRRADSLKQSAEELLPEARRLGEELQFPARVDAAEFTLDGRRLTFIVSSDDRIDHREFVRRAASQFKARIDVRQVGARDRAKLAGGYGICGRELCCASWLATFPSISIRMAKEQELPLNPQKISGLCGRLLCCLSYEEDGYKEMRKTLPKFGQRCSTPTGEGKVIGVNILKRQVTLIVDGARVEVPDRDLGTVVRWDTSSKAAAPPPSISRADAIAQGLIEATEEDLRPAPPPDDDWLGPSANEPAAAGRGRLPGGGPRRESGPRPRRPAGPELPPTRPDRRDDRPAPASSESQAPDTTQRRRNRGRGGDVPASQNALQPSQQPRPPRTEPPPNLPPGRRFERSTGGNAGLPRSGPPPEPGQPPPAGETSGSARRRGRRGRGGRPPGDVQDANGGQ